MHEPGAVVVRLDEQGVLLDVDIAGHWTPGALVVTVPSAPIAPFVPVEFKEGGRCWIPHGGG